MLQVFHQGLIKVTFMLDLSNMSYVLLSTSGIYKYVAKVHQDEFSYKGHKHTFYDALKYTRSIGESK